MRLPPTPRAGAEPSWDVVSASQDRKRLCLGPGLPPDVLNGGLGHPPPPLGLECHTPGLGSRPAPHLADEERRVPLRTQDGCPQEEDFHFGWGRAGVESHLVGERACLGTNRGASLPRRSEGEESDSKANTDIEGDRVRGGR